jgi:hypothetical protein
MVMLGVFGGGLFFVIGLFVHKGLAIIFQTVPNVGNVGNF